MFKRIISIMIAAALLATLFVGCAQNKPAEPADDEPAVEEEVKEPVTITYQLWDGGQGEKIQKLADDFEAETGIHVDIQQLDWGNYWTGLEAAATGNTLPDTFWMHSNNVYYYESNGQMLDVTDYIANSDKIDLSNYPEGLVALYNLDGKQYAIPKDYDTIALWYNKDYFDAAGLEYPTEDWTWDDLYNAAKALTTDDVYGFIAGSTGQEGFYNFVYQNDGFIISEDKKTSGYDDPKTIEAIKYYYRFVDEGLSPASIGDDEHVELFANGGAAMGLYGSWRNGSFKTCANADKLDCVALPKGPNGTQSSIFAGLGNAIAWNTPHPDEAWAWVEYLCCKEGMTEQAELGTAISAFNGTADAWTGAFPEFNVKCYIDMVDYAQIIPYSNHSSVWQDKAFELLAAEAAKDAPDYEAACIEIAAMMNEALAAE